MQQQKFTKWQKWQYWKPSCTTYYFKHWYGILPFIKTSSKVTITPQLIRVYCEKYKSFYTRIYVATRYLQIDIVWREIAFLKCTIRLYHRYHIEANLWPERIRNKGIAKRNERLFATTKNVHFAYDDKLYTQKNSVAMRSPLEPVVVRIFMVDFERNVLPKLYWTYMYWTLSIKISNLPLIMKMIIKFYF